jgi:prepilin-type N-terminal cleavage/methylation domain-containing protein
MFFKNPKNFGFTLIEVMLAMMIAALTLTPLFAMFTTIMKRVNKSSYAYEHVVLCKKFLYEARQKQETDAQEFSLDKKENEYDATLSYSLNKGVTEQSSLLKSAQGLHRETVTISWQENGQKKQDRLVAFVYKKPEQKKQ